MNASKYKLYYYVCSYLVMTNGPKMCKIIAFSVVIIIGMSRTYYIFTYKLA